MDEKLLMKEIIEQRKLKGSSRKPKYATRKLSIGLVSCMLGFTLLVSPSDVWAEEVKIVPVGTEETFDIVSQAEEQVDIVPLAEEPVVDEPLEESIFTAKQKQRLLNAGFSLGEITELENEAKTEKIIQDQSFDLDEFINDKIAEKQANDLQFDNGGEGSEDRPIAKDVLVGSEDRPIAKDVLVGQDGKWTAEVPGGILLKENDTVVATQKEEGKSVSDPTEAKVVAKSETPVIDEIKAGATKITGTGVKGATVTVTRGEDVLGAATVKENGTWEVSVPEGETLAENDVIKATQQETGKAASEEAEKMVTAAETDTTAPGAPEVKAEDNGDVKVTPPTDADTKTVTVKYKDNDGNEKTVTATKGDDNKWTLPAGSEVTVDENSGVITIPADKVKDGEKVTATAKDGSNNESEAGEATAKTPSGAGETGNAGGTGGSTGGTITPTDPTKPGEEDPTKPGTDDKTDDNDGKDSEKTDDKTDGKSDGKNERTPNLPDDKVKVKDENDLTDDEKNKVIDEVKKANPDAKKVEMDGKGNVVLTYDDGFETSIPYKSLVAKVEEGSVVIPPKDKSHAQDPYKGGKDMNQDPIRNKRNQAGAKNIKTGVGSVSGLAGLAGAALAGLFVTKKKEDEDK